MKILCKKHGTQGIVNVCSQIFENIKQGKLIHQENFKIVSISYIDVHPDDDPEGFASHRFCHQCVEKYGLPTNKPVISGELNNIYKEPFDSTKILCYKCFKESLI